MAWIPVQIPAGAVAMAFDFFVSGDPKDDVLVCGIGETNLFSLEAKYIPTNQFSSSRLIDVSMWRGQSVELFIGFMGATSPTNSALEVENIRFYSLEQPRLEITRVGPSAVLSWPASAVGYVVESTVALAPAAWEIATNAPVIVGDRFFLTNSPDAGSRYFRLRQ